MMICLTEKEPRSCCPCQGAGDVDIRILENKDYNQYILNYWTRQNIASQIPKSLILEISKFAGAHTQHLSACAVWSKDKELYAKITKAWTIEYAGGNDQYQQEESVYNEYFGLIGVGYC